MALGSPLSNRIINKDLISFSCKRPESQSGVVAAALFLEPSGSLSLPALGSTVPWVWCTCAIEQDAPPPPATPPSRVTVQAAGWKEERTSKGGSLTAS